MRGSIIKRGAHSWRLKFDTERDVNGKRITKLTTIKGTRKQADAELARLLANYNAGTLAEPSKTTIAVYMRSWIETAATLALSPKTAERYRQIIEQQIIPHLGALGLQRLKPAHLTEWHARLLREGGKDGAPLASGTVGQAHKVLSKALSDAVRGELILRNPVGVVPPPKLAGSEIEILTGDQVKTVLAALRSTAHPIYPHVAVLLTTGMRRGELCGLQWGDVELDAGRLRIERAIERTGAGLRIKGPKTRSGRRTITISAGTIDVLREHRQATLETRLALGLGRLPDDAFIFGTPEGRPINPNQLTGAWRRAVVALGLPQVCLHALRHTHASGLISIGTDVVSVSRRLGHGNPAITLRVYSHLFSRNDEAAAKAIDQILGL